MTQPDPYGPPAGQSPFGGSGQPIPPAGSGSFPVPTPGPYGPPPGQPSYGAPGQPSYGAPGQPSGGPAQPSYGGPAQPYGGAARPPYPQPVLAVAAKSAGLAAVLSFFWLGLGHLYANRIGVGIALMVYDAFLAILAITIFGLVVAVPLWLISTPIVMYLSAKAATEFNRRNGLIVR